MGDYAMVLKAETKFLSVGVPSKLGRLLQRGKQRNGMIAYCLEPRGWQCIHSC